jgi:hypothetical protein
VIVAVPAATAVTTPELTVATEVSDDFQIRLSAVSLGFTVAVRVEVSPTARDSEVLLRDMYVVGTLEPVTVTLHVALLESAMAVMVAVPAATAVTFPEESTVATDVLDEDQLTVPLQLLGVTVAVSDLVSPVSNDMLDVSRVTDVSSLLLFPVNP